MDEKTKALWVALGERLAAASVTKFDEVARSLEHVVEAQEVIARFDWQLPFRGRPRKRYLA